MSKRIDVQDVAARSYWSEEDARVIVGAWQASGETLSVFARRYGVDRRRIGRWADRLEASTSVRFHTVHVTREAGPGSSGRGLEMELHRLSRIYARGGAEIPVSTLADWTAGVGTIVAPLVECLATRVLTTSIVRTDATGLKVLNPHSAEHIDLGSMWAYVGDDRDVLFRYTATGEDATGPWTFLAGRTGYVQADASNVFDRLFTGQVAHAVEVGCWSHGRRRLVAIGDTDCRVAYPLKLIVRLYRIEHLADAQGLTSDGRLALRQERSAPVLGKLQGWCLLTRQTEPPSTDLARAAGYLVNHWRALSRFLEDGRIDLDNNICDAASGITNGMPPARLCRVRVQGRRPQRESECVSLRRAA
jgi:hypothetical protein